MHATRVMFECYDLDLTPLGPIIAAIEAARPFTGEVIVHTSVSQWHSVLSTIRNACPGVRLRPGLKASPVALLPGDEGAWTRYCHAMGEASRFCDSGDVWMEIESWYAAQEQAGRSSEWWAAWVERLSLMSVSYERVWAHHPTVLWDGRRDAVVKMIADKIPNFHWVFSYDAQPMLQDGEDARRLRMLEIVGADRCASHAYVTTPKAEVNDWRDHWPMGMLARALLREESRFLPVHPVSLYLGSGGGDANEDGVPDRAQAMTRLAKLLRKRGDWA